MVWPYKPTIYVSYSLYPSCCLIYYINVFLYFFCGGGFSFVDLISSGLFCNSESLCADASYLLLYEIKFLSISYTFYG